MAVVPAQASAVQELWFSGSFTAQLSITSGDVNGDGTDDLVSFNLSGVGNRATWGPESVRGDKASLTGDIDADGDADLIAVNDTDVQVMRSTGTGFDAPEMWWPNSFTGSRETLAADVDGDNDADLVAVSSGHVWVLRTQ